MAMLCGQYILKSVWVQRRTWSNYFLFNFTIHILWLSISSGRNSFEDVDTIRLWMAQNMGVDTTVDRKNKPFVLVPGWLHVSTRPSIADCVRYNKINCKDNSTYVTFEKGKKALQQFEQFSNAVTLTCIFFVIRVIRGLCEIYSAAWFISRYGYAKNSCTIEQYCSATLATSWWPRWQWQHFRKATKNWRYV